MKTQLLCVGMIGMLAMACGTNNNSTVSGYEGATVAAAEAPSAESLAEQALHIRSLLNRLKETKNAGAIYMVEALAKFNEHGKLVSESLVRDVSLVFSESNVDVAQAIWTAMSEKGNISDRLISDIVQKFTVHGNIGERLAIAVYNVFTLHGNVGERLQSDIIASFTKTSPDAVSQGVTGTFTSQNNTIAPRRTSRLGN